MKRAEYNEFLYIRSNLKKYKPGYGAILTIRTDASPEYKHKLDAFYTSLGFHPASVRVDKHFFDEKERVHYMMATSIPGRSFSPARSAPASRLPWTEHYALPCGGSQIQTIKEDRP